MQSSTTAYVPYSWRKPVGGFIFLTVQQLCLLWWLYRTRRIRLMDFRVWFAAHEMVARRCQIDAAQVPDYTPRELHGLVGGIGGGTLSAPPPSPCRVVVAASCTSPAPGCYTPG